MFQSKTLYQYLLEDPINLKKIQYRDIIYDNSKKIFTKKDKKC